MTSLGSNQTNSGKYEILGKLGQGGMGEVYKVRHRMLDEIRAIKVMRTVGTGHSTRIERFFREARIASKLGHPHIAKLYDFAVDRDGRAFMVLEWVDGINLRDWLASAGPPPISWTLQIVRQTLDAIAYLHSQGIIHRDISPDNLMVSVVDDQPVVKLIDLGVAKQLWSPGALTEDGQFLGKLRYAPPEAFVRRRGSAEVDERGDIYSIGVVLFELLTGQHPFDAQNREGLISAQISDPPKSFTEVDPDRRIPPSLRSVVLEALAKDPHDRPETAEAFSSVLAAAVREVSQRGLPPTSDELRTLDAPVEGLEIGTNIHETQQELDQHFALAEQQGFEVPIPPGQTAGDRNRRTPESAGGTAPQDSESEQPRSFREYSSIGSTLIRAVREHPVSLAVLGSLVLATILILALSSRTSTSATPISTVEQEGPDSPLLDDRGGETHDSEIPPDPEVTQPTERVPARVALVDATGAATSRLLPFLLDTGRAPIIYSSLQEVVSEANANGQPLPAVQLNLQRASGSGEAYDVKLPFCEVTGSLLILRIPEMTPIISKAASHRAPSCGGAELQVIQVLGAVAAGEVRRFDP